MEERAESVRHSPQEAHRLKRMTKSWRECLNQFGEVRACRVPACPHQLISQSIINNTNSRPNQNHKRDLILPAILTNPPPHLCVCAWADGLFDSHRPRSARAGVGMHRFGDIVQTLQSVPVVVYECRLVPRAFAGMRHEDGC